MTTQKQIYDQTHTPTSTTKHKRLLETAVAGVSVSLLAIVHRPDYALWPHHHRAGVVCHGILSGGWFDCRICAALALGHAAGTTGLHHHL